MPYGTDSPLDAFQAINCLATIISPFGITNRQSFPKPQMGPMGLMRQIQPQKSHWSHKSHPRHHPEPPSSTSTINNCSFPAHCPELDLTFAVTSNPTLQLITSKKHS